MSVDKAIAMCEKANVHNALDVYFLFDKVIEDMEIEEIAETNELLSSGN